MNNEHTDQNGHEFAMPRKANECFTDPDKFRLPGALFDAFWREGELALLYGASGTGKSVLAVQIGDALARGRPLDGFEMPTGRRRVLHVDLGHTDMQFQARYSYFAGKGERMKTYTFAENFYHERPPSGADMGTWLRAMVAKCGFQVVIIDDLTALKSTHDGTRDTLRLMRELRSIRDDLGVSILAVTDAEAAGRTGLVTEYDLRRSRILCSAADSVFAIGHHPRSAGNLYVVQRRSRAATIVWNETNAPVCQVKRLASGMLGLEFDERFSAKSDDDIRALICMLKWERDGGATVREAADTCGVSRSTAARLLRKWTPAIEKRFRESGTDESEYGMRNAECGTEEDDGTWDETAEFDLENEWDEDESAAVALAAAEGMDGAEETTIPHSEFHTPPSESSAFRIPQSALFMASRRRRSVYDLERDVNGNGREIWVESRWPTGQPVIWYEFDRKGNKIRRERDAIGINVKTLGPGPYL